MPDRKPREDELDVYGLTHPGRVRKNNQDHFLICALQRHIAVYSTSLPEPDVLARGEDRLAFLAMVADGVGGGPMGEEASRVAVESITEYVLHCTRCYYDADPSHEEAFTSALSDAAMASHTLIADRAAADPERRGMATTLTLWIGVWPWAYLLQVGDSRCYLLRDGELHQISRDQTMAQELVDEGVITQAQVAGSRWANTLSSSIGGSQTAPVVNRMDQRWGDVGLLCSDGLTRHVGNDRIRERLTEMTSAKQVSEALLQDALDAGGSDNITIVVGRTLRRRE